MAEGRVDWLRGLTVAHRGLHSLRDGGHWVENGAAAFEAAMAAGFAIECDVRLSADGVAVVFHDDTLDRLTHVKGPVSAQPAAVLMRIPLMGLRDAIPTLAQMLAQVAGRVPLLIELKLDKGSAAAPLCAAVAEALAGYRGHYAIMSFAPEVPEWFAANAPEAPRGVIFEKRDLTMWYRALFRRRAIKQAEFIAVDVRALPNPFVAKCREQGLAVATWTVRNPDQRAIAEAYADTVIAEADGIG